MVLYDEYRLAIRQKSLKGRASVRLTYGDPVRAYRAGRDANGMTGGARGIMAQLVCFILKRTKLTTQTAALFFQIHQRGFGID